MTDRFPKESEYKKLREEIKNCKGWDCEYHKNKIKEIYEKIAVLNDDIKYHNERIKEYENRLAEVRERVKELKNK